MVVNLRTLGEEILSLQQVVYNLTVHFLHRCAMELFGLYVRGELQRHARIALACGWIVCLAIEIGEHQIVLCTFEVCLALHSVVCGELLVGVVRHVYDLVENDVDVVDALVEVFPCTLVARYRARFVVLAHLQLPCKVAEHAAEVCAPRVPDVARRHRAVARVDIVVDDVEESGVCR